MKPGLVVTCEELPLPPMTGSIRKLADILEALAPTWEIHAIVYDEPSDRSEQLIEYWKGRDVTFHRLQRRREWRHARCLRYQLSLPTVTRDFAAEQQIARATASRVPETRVLVDLISGSPLCRAIRRGVVVSGHDCISWFWRQQLKWTRGWKRRIHFGLRRRFAEVTERRYYHLADRLHVVAARDAEQLRRVNPGIRPVVIPLGGPTPNPRKVAPMRERQSGGVIWGNLAFPPIAEGFDRLLADLRRTPDRAAVWQVLGGLPETEARQRFPVMTELGLRYHGRVDDVSSVLGGHRWLVLPDLAGSGQKTRLVDGLAHGCCVIGMPEVFLDMPGESGTHYHRVQTSSEVFETVGSATADQAACMSAAAQTLFLAHYSHAAQARSWDQLLRSLPPVEVVDHPVRFL
jgi:glycosyltransferase involved in cell wall biosynthesis